MKTYNYANLLSECISYLSEKGRTQDNVDFLFTILPGAWAPYILADALEATRSA